eukprot:TRINITY_DN5573_c0_g1_i3.p1 TRINITY_DN5573_c0_g1~~TRINITY_DN5573_c0_g1_i3.p1  ORF type:complete len:299 (+),score=62.03 TRINITY_DN5573_c0_g1_i3:107-1003(+)
MATAKLKKDVTETGLGVVVIADWFNVDVIKKLRFFDENSGKWWTPATGGANVPALNDLLADYGIALGSRIFQGEINNVFRNTTAFYDSGTSIIRFPQNGMLGSFWMMDKTEEMLVGAPKRAPNVPIVGIYPADPQPNFAGRLAIFGDSSCMDDATVRQECHWILDGLLDFATSAILPQSIPLSATLTAPYSEDSLPERLPGSDILKFSHVIGHSPQCESRQFLRQTQNLTAIPEEAWYPAFYSDGHGPAGQLREGISSRVGQAQEKVFPWTLLVLLSAGIAIALYRWKSASNVRREPV